jgi:phospholipid/cholesterol/gamma-HCH transport system permease protein
MESERGVCTHSGAACGDFDIALRVVQAGRIADVAGGRRLDALLADRGEVARALSTMIGAKSIPELTQRGAELTANRQEAARHQEAGAAIIDEPQLAECVDRSGWHACVESGSLTVSLSGDWSVRNETSNAGTAACLLQYLEARAIHFDSSALGSWDSSLLVFLSSLREISNRRHIDFDPSGLPAATRRLLMLLPTEVDVPVPAQRRIGMLERVGTWTLDRWSDGVAVVALLGEAVLRVVPALRGRVRARAGDFLAFTHAAGVGALPMVALVNVLVGAIVAFVGGIQLRRLGAEIYVSNLVGVTEVREMAPLITAIVMSGRTGSAYAAEIAAMQGSEEIDAFRALGIRIFDYLILPRISALTTMMAPLWAYASALGIFGGFAVAVFMMHMSAGTFVAHLRAAVAGADIALGLSKSVVFGVWIAIAGCRIGLGAGRSATDVGHAATTAAVSGIVGVIALDALFDVCAEAFGI